MKSTCLAPVLCFCLLMVFVSCQEQKQPGLDDFAFCLAEPSESFDNVRDLELGYALSFPKNWEYQTKFESVSHAIGAGKTLLDSTNQQVLNRISMTVFYDTYPMSDMDKYLEAGLNNLQRTGARIIASGNGEVFSKACNWLIYQEETQPLASKSLQLFFVSRDGAHIVTYEYNARDDADWFQHVCEMLRFKQDV